MVSGAIFGFAWAMVDGEDDPEVVVVVAGDLV